MVKAPLRNAVELSLNIAPGSLAKSLDPGKDFLDRLGKAVHHAQARELPCESDEFTPPESWIVRLDDFARWAEASPRDWALPEKFPGRKAIQAAEETGSSASPATDVDADDLSPRARIPYEKLVAVLATKAGYSLDEPYSDAESLMALAKPMGIVLARSKTGEILTAAKLRRDKK